MLYNTQRFHCALNDAILSRWTLLSLQLVLSQFEPESVQHSVPSTYFDSFQQVLEAEISVQGVPEIDEKAHQLAAEWSDFVRATANELLLSYSPL